MDFRSVLSSRGDSQNSGITLALLVLAVIGGVTAALLVVFIIFNLSKGVVPLMRGEILMSSISGWFGSVDDSYMGLCPSSRDNPKAATVNLPVASSTSASKAHRGSLGFRLR